MTDEIKYGKPPIVEVVCEFRFVPSQPWDPAVPGLVFPQLSQSFPKRSTLRSFQGELVPTEGGLRQQLQHFERAQFLSEDDKAFVQIGPDFLAINHLAPYPSWENFLPLVQQAFEAYRPVAIPKGVQRLGLRYINQIVFPASTIRFEDYLQLYPFLGPSLPQTMQAFAVLCQAVYASNRDALRLQLTSADPAEAGHATVLLDFDYFLAKPETIGLNEVFSWIGQAHDQVLSAFEACLTERTKIMFAPFGN